jgi:hypothetical protein
MNGTLMIRSFVQYVVTAVLSLAPVIAAVNWLVDVAKVPINEMVLAGGLEAILFALIVGALNKWGEKWPLINKFLSLGTSASGPAYVKPGETAAAITVTEKGTQVYTESGTGAPAPATFEAKPAVAPPEPSNTPDI